jgi:hypothetical protein
MPRAAVDAPRFLPETLQFPCAKPRILAAKSSKSKILSRAGPGRKMRRLPSVREQLPAEASR